MVQCPECTSQRLYKDGVRQTNSGDVQRYLCRDCGHRFSENGAAKSFNMTSGKGSSCQIGADPYAHGQVINLAVIEPLREGPAGATIDLKPKLLEYSLWMKKEAYADATIIGRTKLLKVLTKRGASLYDPESIKTTISKQPWSEGRKANAVDAYSTFLKMTGGKWQPPKYQSISKIPFIPTENEIDQIISACSSRMATFVQLLKETGIRCGEAWQLKWTDFDTETRTLRITPEKGSNPRIAKISLKLKSMLEALPKNYKERIFSNPNQDLDTHRDIFCQQRKRLVFKLKNPRLIRITFHTLRHWKGTMEYHRTKDILYVKQVLGHKRIENTLIYVQLAEELFKDEIEYISKVAKTEGEACTLIDAGFDFVCDFSGNKLFRKRK